MYVAGWCTKRLRPREQSIHSKTYTGPRRPHLLPAPSGKTYTVCARVHVSLCAAAPCTSAVVPVSNRIIRTPIQGHANLTPFPSRAKITCTLSFQFHRCWNRNALPHAMLSATQRVAVNKTCTFFSLAETYTPARTAHTNIACEGGGIACPSETECTLFSLGTDPGIKMLGCWK